MAKHGGARENSGRKKGFKFPHTLEKEKARALADQIARDIVLKHWPKIIEAQSAHAVGVDYMVLRNADGTFVRATDEKQIDAALASGDFAYRIFTQAPNTQAFTALSDRVFDKPVERHELTGEDGGPLVVQWKG